MRTVVAVLSLSGLFLFPLLAGAETASTEGSFANSVSNIASAAENGAGEEAAKTELGKAALAAANGELDKVTDSILSTSNFTHLDVSLGGDSFGLDTGTKTKTEIIGTITDCMKPRTDFCSIRGQSSILIIARQSISALGTAT